VGGDCIADCTIPYFLGKHLLNASCSYGCIEPQNEVPSSAGASAPDEELCHQLTDSIGGISIGGRMRVAIIGSNGQLGVDLCQVLASKGVPVVPLTHEDVDVSDAGQVERVIGSGKIDVVISTAAFHKVEQCENEPTPAFVVNAIGARNLALTCRRINAVLVHFSTDYVFDGSRQEPYTEMDPPHPLNVYGVSKLAGENLVALTWARSFVVRTCGLYGLAGSKGKGGNFVETMLQKAAQRVRIQVVDDQVLTPTFTGDLAQAISQLIQNESYGLYHITSEGQCSWYEFAQEIFQVEGVDADLIPVSTADFRSHVRRPAYSVLSKNKLRNLGIYMPHWREGLKSYLLKRRARRREIVSPKTSTGV
jgi:dTDP-4-dehydrorhamnose reductase